MIKHKKGDLNLVSFPIGNYQCNCSILFSEKTKEAIIIDPGNDHQTLLKVVDHLGVKPKKLLHTHAHFDHIGRSNEVKQATGATIHLHKGDQFLYDNLQKQGLFFGQMVGAPSPIDQHLIDEEEFGIDSDDLQNFLKTLHTPGHTPGSCCFYTEYFDLPMLFSGDTLFERSIGRTDLPGGDMNAIIKSIKERLLVLPEDTLVTPGHGEDTRIFEEKKYNPFLC